MLTWPPFLDFKAGVGHGGVFRTQLSEFGEEAESNDEVGEENVAEGALQPHRRWVRERSGSKFKLFRKWVTFMFHWYYMITSKGKKTHVTCESQISNYIVNQLIFRLALWHNGNILNFPWIEGSEAAKESQPLNLTMGGSEATEETPATVAVATKRGATHISSKNRISVLDDQRIQDLENRHKICYFEYTYTEKITKSSLSCNVVIKQLSSSHCHLLRSLWDWEPFSLVSFEKWILIFHIRLPNLRSKFERHKHKLIE